MKSRVSWDAVAGAAGYKLTLQSLNTATQWAAAGGVPYPATSPVDITVQPNTTYRVTVAALNADGTTIRESPPAPFVEFLTPPLAGAPDTPANLAQEIIP